MAEDPRQALIGQNVLVNFPDSEGPSYHLGSIIEHLHGTTFDVQFKDGIANVSLSPRTRGIHWFIKKGDWNKFKAKRLKYYGRAV